MLVPVTPSEAALKAADAAYDQMDTVCGSDDVKVLACHMDEFAAKARAAAIKECIAATCEHCASGGKPRILDGYPAGILMHLFPGYPPRECWASRIRRACAP